MERAAVLVVRWKQEGDRQVAVVKSAEDFGVEQVVPVRRVDAVGEDERERRQRWNRKHEIDRGGARASRYVHNRIR